MASHMDSTSSCDTGFPPRLSSPAIPHISIPQYCVIRKPHTNCKDCRLRRLHGFHTPQVECIYFLWRNVPVFVFLTISKRLTLTLKSRYGLACKVLFMRSLEVVV